MAAVLAEVKAVVLARTPWRQRQQRRRRDPSTAGGDPAPPAILKVADGHSRPRCGEPELHPAL